MAGIDLAPDLHAFRGTGLQISPCTASDFFLLRGKKKRTRHPAPRASRTGYVTRFAQPTAVTPLRYVSLHRRSRGPLRWAVHGPAQLSSHRFDSTPSTPITLTLLTGLPVGACLNVIRRVDNRAALSTKARPGGKAASGVFHPAQAVRWSDRPRQEAECRCCAEGHLAGMPNEARRAKEGPSSRPSEQHRSEGSLSKAKARMPGGLLLLTFLGQARKVRRPAGRNQNYQQTAITSPAQL